ncbi:MAG: SDR family NAD(P)-dependent oxidoreductase, partial [Actinobacteria bacterium]|nr:SDR family NAD(P)-dependent oxidoreductase [Actinomycetota bacterium]
MLARTSSPSTAVISVATGPGATTLTVIDREPSSRASDRANPTRPAFEAAFKEVEAKLGPVEILVSNAGITNDTLLLRMSESDFTNVIDANLTGAFRVSKRAAQGMLKARKGRIIFMSSVVGLLGQTGQANYAASKAGLVGFARSL